MMTGIPRRVFLSAMGAGLVLGLAGTAPAWAQGKTFVLVQINQQALFFNQVNAGAEKGAKETGNKLVIYNANNDPSKQNDAIDTYIQQKVAGIAVDAIDVNGIMPAIEQATKAGIPVVALDAILPAGPQKAQVGVDNAKAGADLAHYYLNYVKTHMSGKSTLGIVGALNSYIQNVRQKGFEDVVKSAPGIKIAGVVDGRNVQDTALNAAENLITANPDMTTIYATGEPALIGAIAAVASQGKQKSIKIFGWDLSPEAIAGIDKGEVIAVVQQDPALMGEEAIKALVKVADGKTVDKNIYVPVTIVTEKNVAPYRSVFK
ncbi:substrate-binding domain-containing protein [Solirhodobacter olei]|uniref:ABC transporter substrate-binding protein n=1 Tax=Solirhodobacter olei TaxID=2493082 RepID=UPI001F4ED429|nr:substrate-binding domain-containing protein [Solirhodobacter olei]